MSLVSVVIPTYNRASELTRAIDSVLQQDFTDYNIIVVDDGSDDNTKQVVNEYSSVDLYAFPTNRGQAAARKKGVEVSDGKYISFLDSDDQMLPSHLSMVMKNLQHSPERCIGAFTGYRRIGNGSSNVSTVPEGLIGYQDVLDGHIIGGYSQHTYQADVFDTVEVTRDIRAGTAYDLSLRLLGQGYEMVGINQPLVNKYVSEDSISEDVNRLVEGHRSIIQAHGENLTQKGISRLYFSEGTSYASDGEIKKAQNRFRRALFTYPLNPRYLIYYTASVGGKNAYRYMTHLKDQCRNFLKIFT